MSQLHEVQRAGTRVRNHHLPTSIEEALEVLAADPRAVPIAGGTDLLLELARGSRPEVETLVDLSAIPGLDDIDLDGELLGIGPLTTHNQVVASDLVVERSLPLAQACLEVGSPQLRNRATVVGNLVTASPANDTISALMALDAELTIRSVGGERRTALADFYPGFRSTSLAPGELVTRVEWRALHAARRGVFVKLGLRKAQAISVVHVAVVLEFDGETVTSARVALGSVAPVVGTSAGAQALLEGDRLSDEVIALAAEAARRDATPIDDLRGTGVYRDAVVGVMVRRGLEVLRDGTESATWPPRPPLLAPGPVASALVAAPAARAAARALTSDSEITVNVNGVDVTAGAAVGETLLDWLRDSAHEAAPGSLRGTQEGCAEGECGACTVQFDGSAVMSCLVPAARADEASVTTVEGLAGDGHGEAGSLHRLQQAFVDCFAVQCGFCIPGFIVAGASLLDEIDDPDDAQIRAGLAGNLCRCTGYYKIIEAVHRAAGRVER